jgi:hypothetical protein
MSELKPIKDNPPEPATSVPQSVLVERICNILNDDYADFEVTDVLEAIGPALTELMEDYYAVRIRHLGVFDFRINKPKRYFNVHNNRYEYTDWSYTPTFEFVRDNKRSIQNKVKELHVQTLRQQPDYVCPPEDQLRAYEFYLAKLGRWYPEKLAKFTRIKTKEITELSTADELADVQRQIDEYKQKLDLRYATITADIKQKMLEIKRNEKLEGTTVKKPDSQPVVDRTK